MNVEMISSIEFMRRLKKDYPVLVPNYPNSALKDNTKIHVLKVAKIANYNIEYIPSQYTNLPELYEFYEYIIENEDMHDWWML